MEAGVDSREEEDLAAEAEMASADSEEVALAEVVLEVVGNQTFQEEISPKNLRRFFSHTEIHRGFTELHRESSLWISVPSLRAGRRVCRPGCYKSYLEETLILIIISSCDIGSPFFDDLLHIRREFRSE